MSLKYHPTPQWSQRPPLECPGEVRRHVRTLSLYRVGIDGGVRASGGTVRLQDIFAHPPCDAGQLCGLQDKGLAVLGQQLGSTLIAGKWGQALNFLAGHVTAGARILDKKGDTTQ